MKRIICFFLDHEWTETHAFRNEPDWGARCTRCGKQTETYKEFSKRVRKGA